MDDIFLILDYDILKNNNDDVEILWNGNVTLSSQLVDCMIPSVVQDDMKIYAVVDQRFNKQDNVQFDNPEAFKNSSNTITIILKGTKITDIMRCHAFTKRSKNFKRRNSDIVLKGFFLEPLCRVREDDYVTNDACMTIFKFNNEDTRNQTVMRLDSVYVKHALIVEKLGCVAFASGSQGSAVTFLKDTKKSVTIVSVTSDQNPFVARLETGHGTKRFVCKSDGEIKESFDDGGHMSSLMEVDNNNNTTTTTTTTHDADDPLKILNVRLAKGEITIDEYKAIQKAIKESIV